MLTLLTDFDLVFCFFFFFNDTATTEIYTLSLHDALPIYLVQLLAEGALDGVHRNLRIEGRHAVLQPGQLLGHVGRHQVAARGQHLAELHEDGPQLLQGLAQALAARLVQPPAQREHRACAAHPGMLEARQHQLVESVAEHHPEDGQPAKKPAHGLSFSKPGRDTTGEPMGALAGAAARAASGAGASGDRKSTRLDSSHTVISYAVFCLEKKKKWLREQGSRRSGWMCSELLVLS